MIMDRSKCEQKHLEPVSIPVKACVWLSLNLISLVKVSRGSPWDCIDGTEDSSC